MRALPLALALGACAYPSFEPPDVPAHDDERGGSMHAALSETPFRCPDPAASPSPSRTREKRERSRGVSCTQTATRPPDRLLSCDAMGCHGGFDYASDPSTAARDLRGGNGPSCYTCHGKEWKDDR